MFDVLKKMVMEVNEGSYFDYVLNVLLLFFYMVLK